MITLFTLAHLPRQYYCNVVMWWGSRVDNQVGMKGWGERIWVPMWLVMVEVVEMNFFGYLMAHLCGWMWNTRAVRRYMGELCTNCALNRTTFGNTILQWWWWYFWWYWLRKWSDCIGDGIDRRVLVRGTWQYLRGRLSQNIEVGVSICVFCGFQNTC